MWNSLKQMLKKQINLEVQIKKEEAKMDSYLKEKLERLEDIIRGIRTEMEIDRKLSEKEHELLMLHLKKVQIMLGVEQEEGSDEQDNRLKRIG